MRTVALRDCEAGLHIRMDQHFAKRIGYAVTLFVLLGCRAWLPTAHGQDFATQVAPILQRHCIRCHADGDAEGDVSFSSATSFIESGVGDIGPTGISRLMAAITPDEVGHAEMPQDADPLSAADRQVISDWISVGAVWPADVAITAPVVSDLDWWSLRPIAPLTSIDDQSDRDASEHPIDAFINKALKAHDLTAAPQASAAVLLRRLTYDLTGLPPTPAELEAFLRADQQDSEQAWLAAVDRLLTSPAFGEKWAQHWLDLARYAETHGYDKDKQRLRAWPYRDYVIDSFNQDKPFDRFVQEQLAGDVLYPNDPDGIAALGFLAAGPWDYIGHVEVGEGKLDGRIAKHFDRDEMLSAVFNVFMSTTVQCAQCHHHKFDPIRMEDYYRGQAVFAGVDRANRVYKGLSALDQLAVEQLKRELVDVEAARSGWQQQLQDQVDKRSDGARKQLEELLRQHPIQPADAYGYHSQIEAKPDQAKWVQLDLAEPIEVGSVKLIPAFDDFAQIGRGFGFPVRYRVAVSNDPSFSDGGTVLLDATDKDQPNPKSRIIEALGRNVQARHVRVTCTKLAERQNDFIFALAEVEVADKSGKIVSHQSTVTALDSIEAPVRWSRQNLVDGIYWQAEWPQARRTQLFSLEQQLADAEQQVFTVETQSQWQVYQDRIAELKHKLAAFPPGEMVFAVASDFSGEGQFQPTKGRLRPIHLLHRGDLRNPGEAMQPGAPSLWEIASSHFDDMRERREPATDSPASEGAARADLARYVTAQENPLFWRSLANRIWQWTFHQPLVGTPNDFGRMGMTPTHPALLDYLAARLRDDPQHSIKSLVRLLVTSDAYRRSSENLEKNQIQDAGNQFYWRANRRKLSVEEFRDSMLAVANKLPQRDPGGPSFQDFVVDKPAHSPHYEYELADPNDPAAFRRSVYRFVVRSQPQPMMTALDCADPSISVPQRDESTTSLQALTQWNDRLVEAMSIHFAERLQEDIQREAVAPADAPLLLIHRACLFTLGRLPEPDEQKLLIKLHQQHGIEVVARVIFNMSAFNYVD